MVLFSEIKNPDTTQLFKLLLNDRDLIFLYKGKAITLYLLLSKNIMP